MVEAFIQLPADGTGKKTRTRSRTIGVNVVHEQGVFLAGRETWVAYADAVAFAQNKHHIALFNATGSGVILRPRKLFAVNLQTAAITGVLVRFDIKKITAASAGTTITPEAMDTTNVALPAGVTVRTNGTITEGNLLYPWIASNEEETAVVGLSKTMFQQWANILMEGNEMQEHTLREGQGLTVKQITASTVGSYGWILVFDVE